MFGFGFVLVPFYNVFCEWTGLNGKVKTEAQVQTQYVVDQSRWVTVEFVTTVNGAMPLKFKPEVAKLFEPLGGGKARYAQHSYHKTRN